MTGLKIRPSGITLIAIWGFCAMIELRALALCSLPRKCMAQCRAGLVFDNPNIAPLGMLNQRESPPRKSTAFTGCGKMLYGREDVSGHGFIPPAPACRGCRYAAENKQHRSAEGMRGAERPK